ncbi:YhgE/Pip family protein [Neobacillus sp. LXY-4]|uniref:YhgE/Pip family protein n=1 Tax=Neobacillus sp. LXY-4 TaxID=3379826 RepID=UPI003EE070F1
MRKNLIREEWNFIIRNKKLLIPIIAILFIPVLYTGMFLWAFWDPYDRLDDLPVVVVNEDKGATLDGEEIKLGNELVAKLKDSQDFQFDIVDNKQQAMKDLEKQKYYMLIEIPSDFSKNATTLLDKDPQKLDLVYVPNESYNFLSAQIGGTAIEKIKASLSQKVSETYAETMFSKVEELADGMEAASDGAKKIDDGAIQLKDGSKTLYDSLSVLANKSVEFNEGMVKADSGIKEIAAGSQTLSNGLGQLQEKHMMLETASDQLLTGEKELAVGIAQTKSGLQQVEGKLPEMVLGTAELQKGSQNLSTSLQNWQAGAEKAANSANQLNEGITSLQQQLSPMLSQLPPEQQEMLKATFSQLAAGSKQLSAGNATLAGYAGELANGADTISGKLGVLNEGQKQLQAGVHQLANGSVQLDDGAREIITGHEKFNSGMKLFGEKFAEASAGSVKLTQGSSELSNGLTMLTEGASKIVDGAGKLTDGAEQLSSGNSELESGTHELADKLADGAQAASAVNGNEKTYNMFAAPVNVKNEKINEVPNYGTGFAPYFLSLGLFVGALLLSIVFPLREPAGVPRNALSWFASKFVILSGVGIIQALVAVSVLIFGLGIDVQNVPLFVLFSVVTSLTFLALIQVLVTTMGDAGRFVAIVILILQLTTSAGTFPLELIPKFLQGFNTFLPMTYTVQGFKSVISSGDLLFMWHNIGVLFVFILLFVGGTIMYFTTVHKRRFSGIAE